MSLIFPTDSSVRLMRAECFKMRDVMVMVSPRSAEPRSEARRGRRTRGRAPSGLDRALTLAIRATADP